MNDMSQHSFLDRVQPSTTSNLLLWIILAFVGVFVIWAALTELDRSVYGSGRIIPSAHLQVVSNFEGGVVKEIKIKTGDVVRQGQILVRLDPTATGAEYGSNQSQFEALSARIARLEGEVAGRAPAFPAGSDNLAQQVEIERTLHASRMADLSSLLSAATARAAQARRAVAETQAALASRHSYLQSAETELRLIRPLVERGIEPRLSLVQAENRAAAAASDVTAAAASVTRAQAQVMEAEASMSQQRQEWRARAAQDLAAAQAEMVVLRRSLPALSARVARTEVRAPLSGRINRVLVTTVGGTVQPGAPLVEIVPSEGSLLIEVQIRPADIGWVRLGQKARISITAYDPAVYGALHGEIVSMSPDATLNERTGETFYTVRVATGEKLRDQSGQVLQIGPGMVADVAMLGEKRSVLSYILTPFTRLTQTAFREQ